MGHFSQQASKASSTLYYRMNKKSAKHTYIYFSYLRFVMLLYVVFSLTIILEIDFLKDKSNFKKFFSNSEIYRDRYYENYVWPTMIIQVVVLCVLLLPKQVFDLRLDLKIHFSNFNVTLNAHSKATNSNSIHLFQKNYICFKSSTSIYILKKTISNARVNRYKDCQCNISNCLLL